MTDESRRLEAANAAWIPLQAAPFNFLRSYELGSWQDLDPFLAVRDSLAQSGIRADWNSKTGTVAVHPPWADHPIEVYLFRSAEDFVRQLDVSGDPDNPGLASLRALAADLATVSDGLANLFQNAVEDGRCRIFARPGSVLANFKLIPIDIWRNFSVLDWGAGTAISVGKEMLFSVHVSVDEGDAPFVRAQALLSAETRHGRKFLKWYLSKHAGIPYAEEAQKLIRAEFEEAMKAEGLSTYGAGERTLPSLLTTARQIRALGLAEDDIMQLVNRTE